MVIETVSPPVSPSVVAAILMIQKPSVTAGTLLATEALFIATSKIMWPLFSRLKDQQLYAARRKLQLGVTVRFARRQSSGDVGSDQIDAASFRVFCHVAGAGRGRHISKRHKTVGVFFFD